MNYEILTTTAGPVILYKNQILVLQDEQPLIELLEEDKGFFAEMQAHILGELRAAMDEFVEAADANINSAPTKIYQYVSAYQMYWLLKNNSWPRYLQAIEEACEDEN